VKGLPFSLPETEENKKENELQDSDEEEESSESMLLVEAIRAKNLRASLVVDSDRLFGNRILRAETTEESSGDQPRFRTAPRRSPRKETLEDSSGESRTKLRKSAELERISPRLSPRHNSITTEESSGDNPKFSSRPSTASSLRAVPNEESQDSSSSSDQPVLPVQVRHLLSVLFVLFGLSVLFVLFPFDVGAAVAAQAQQAAGDLYQSLQPGASSPALPNLSRGRVPC
jgi:hypothetical protein